MNPRLLRFAAALGPAGLADFLPDLEALVADNAALRAEMDRARSDNRRRSGEWRKNQKKKRASDVTVTSPVTFESRENNVTGDVRSPPQTPPSDTDSGFSNGNTIRIGEGVSDPERATATQRHVTGAHVSAAFDDWWQANRSSMANPRTGTHWQKMGDAARMVNQQARIEGAEPAAVLARVMAAFTTSTAAGRCGHMPGAIAGCFPDLIAPRNGKPIVASRAGVKGDPVPEAGNG